MCTETNQTSLLFNDVESDPDSYPDLNQDLFIAGFELMSVTHVVYSGAKLGKTTTTSCMYLNF